MTSTTDNTIIDHYRDWLDRMTAERTANDIMECNRHGLIIGTAMGMLNYEIKFVRPDAFVQAVSSMKKVHAWLEWASKLRRDRWGKYEEARKIPDEFNAAWDTFIESKIDMDFQKWYAHEYGTTA